MMQYSIHDNTVLGYTVDCEHRRIVIRTKYRDRGQPYEKTDIHFDGVLGYMIRDCMTGILFDIAEDSIDRILTEHAADFAWGAKYGWPWPKTDATSIRKHIEESGAKVFRIQASTAFDGFVIAQQMRLTEVEPAAGGCGPEDAAEPQR